MNFHYTNQQAHIPFIINFFNELITYGDILPLAFQELMYHEPEEGFDDDEYFYFKFYINKKGNEIYVFLGGTMRFTYDGELKFIKIQNDKLNKLISKSVNYELFSILDNQDESLYYLLDMITALNDNILNKLSFKTQSLLKHENISIINHIPYKLHDTYIYTLYLDDIPIICENNIYTFQIICDRCLSKYKTEKFIYFKYKNICHKCLAKQFLDELIKNIVIKNFKSLNKEYSSYLYEEIISYDISTNFHKCKGV